jgi:threonine/homoserine/homoserine lactone efflux protein
MSFDTFLAALMFSVVMGFTPGPNNVMLASSGATHGVKRTWPYLMGVAIGFPVMILLIGLGLATILLASGTLQLGMKIVSCLYLLWLAIQIGRSSSIAGNAAKAKPLTFVQAAAFQWVNPKAWRGWRDLGLYGRRRRASLSPGRDHRGDEYRCGLCQQPDLGGVRRRDRAMAARAVGAAAV